MWLLSYSDVVNRHDNFLSYCPKHRRPFEKVKSSTKWSENFVHILANHCHLFFLCIFSPLLSLNISIRLPATLTVASAGGRLVPFISPLLAVGLSIMLNVSRFVVVGLDVVVDLCCFAVWPSMILDLLMSIIEEDLMTLLTTTGARKPWPFELPLVRQPG